MVVGELPVGRRFQLKYSGPIFMKVELKHNLEEVVPPDNGTPVINLGTGFVFWMKSNARALLP
jgi:hypothetical protein